MRNLFAFNMVTLDGFFEGPNRDIQKVNLKLVKTRTFKSGNVLLYYQPDKK